MSQQKSKDELLKELSQKLEKNRTLTKEEIAACEAAGIVFAQNTQSLTKSTPIPAIELPKDIVNDDSDDDRSIYEKLREEMVKDPENASYYREIGYAIFMGSRSLLHSRDEVVENNIHLQVNDVNDPFTKYLNEIIKAGELTETDILNRYRLGIFASTKNAVETLLEAAKNDDSVAIKFIINLREELNAEAKKVFSFLESYNISDEDLEDRRYNFQFGIYALLRYWGGCLPRNKPLTSEPLSEAASVLLGNHFADAAAWSIDFCNRKNDVIDWAAEWEKKAVKKNVRARKNESTKQKLAEALKSSQYFIHTAQEVDTLICSAGGIKSRPYWNNSTAKDCRVFKMPNSSHRVEIPRAADSYSDPYSWEKLVEFTDSQNSDFALALFYVLSLLAPPPAVNTSPVLGGWIDLNDVMEKIGWMKEKPSKARQEELRMQIWNYIVYGEEAIVVGERTTPYKNKNTGEILDTYVESSAWKITDKRHIQRALFDENKVAPVQAHIVISEQWKPLLTSPDLSQYFPLGELLGEIPPHKVGGDWARIIGLNLMRMWRMKPREALEGTLNPTRRELLMHYLPKTKTVEELLEGTHPKRAVEHYFDALGYLREKGIICESGDSDRRNTPEKMLEPYIKVSRQGWGNRWLDAKSNVFFGWQAWLHIAQRASALPRLEEPKDLKAPVKKRRKRVFN